MERLEIKYRVFNAVLVSLTIALLYNFANASIAHLPGFELNTTIDDYIPFSPAWVIGYILYYPAIILPFLLVSDKLEMKRIRWSYIAVLIMTIPIHLLFVVRMYRPIIENTGIFSDIIRMIYSNDEPVSLFPSLHVAFIWTAAHCMYRKYPRGLWIFFIFAVLVSLSTLFIKQHYIIDIVGGILVAYIACNIHRLLKR